MSQSPLNLRKDQAANLAVLAGFGTGTAVTVAIISQMVQPGYIEQRSNPVYWLLMAPIVVWVLFAAEWNRGALWLLPGILTVSPIGAIAIALVAPSPSLWVVAVVSIVLGGLGHRWRRASGLRKQR